MSDTNKLIITYLLKAAVFDFYAANQRLNFPQTVNKQKRGKLRRATVALQFKS